MSVLILTSHQYHHLVIIAGTTPMDRASDSNRMNGQKITHTLE